MKVISKGSFNSSKLTVFKLNVEQINSKLLEDENVLVNSVMLDSSDFLVISRLVGNNVLERMNETVIVNYFKENGSYSLIKTIIKVIKIFHENGLYHGGLKLSNIMLNDIIDEEKEYKICDYFYHYLLNEEELDISQRNVNYITPEELSGKECNIKKDMWNIGVLLYKIMSGKFPFQCESIETTKSNILEIKFDDLDVEFSEYINPLIHKLLTKESKNRMSIEDFEIEINEIYSTNYIDKVIPFIEGVKFIEENKHKYISISEDGKTIVNTVGSTILSICNAKCNLNIIMSKFIHHFLFTINHGKNGICFGCNSANNDVEENNESGNDITSCSIALLSDYSYLHGSNGNKMKEGQFIDVFAKEGEEYEVIFNLNQNMMFIKQGNGEEILLFTDIKSPVCPYCSTLYKDDSISLMKYWIE